MLDSAVASDNAEDAVTHQDLPSFERPPLIEVVSGVLFDPVTSLTGPLLGQFWRERLAGFGRKPTEMPPLPAQLELLQSNFPPASQFVADPPPGPRYWFVSDDDDRVVQVQKDRFLCNWRKTEARHAYPRFDAVYGFFDEQLSAFAEFLEKEVDAELVARQYELTYVNHVPDGAAQTVGDVLPDLVWRQAGARWLGAPEHLEAGWTFRMPKDLGRLRVRAQTGLLSRGNQPVLILELTARGFGEDQRAWFENAHEWIVRGFSDVISDAKAQTWGRA